MQFIKPSAVLILFLFALPLYNHAQENKGEDLNKKNILKLNLLGGVYKNIPLYYERALKGKTSFSIGMSYFLPREKSRLLKIDIGSAYRKQSRLGGFSVSPELKFYSQQPALKGMYLSVYLKMMYLDANIDFDIIDSSDVSPQTFKLAAGGYFTGLGAGIQLGYQWVFNNGLAVDFFFFGPGISHYELQYTLEERAENDAQIDWERIDEEWKKDGNNMPFGSSAEVFAGDKSIHVKWPFTVPNARIGLSVGYSF